MRLKEFSYKNIISYGNKLQTFTFDEKPGLILVEGENGAGKSSIKEALTVSIYGRSAIRKMKDIPNWINRNAYTNVKFVTNAGETIEIDRGIDPNFSDIKINSAHFNLPDKRKVDEFIEDELVKIPFTVFCNTISLSFDDFKSFVNLSKEDKRKIIDRIFGIDILSEMRVKVKEKLRENKSELDLLELASSRNDSNLSSYEAQLDSLKDRLTKKKEELTVRLSTEIEEKKKEVELAQKKKEDYQAKVKDVSTELVSATSARDKIKTSISDFSSKLLVYSKNRCPHCLNDLQSNSSNEIKDRIEKKLDELKALLPDAQKKVDDLNELSTSLLFDKGDIDSDYFNKKAELSSLESSLEAAQETEDPEELSSISSIISNLQTQIKADKDSVEELTRSRNLYLRLDDLLSDNGIKKSMIGKIIPTLNNRILEISKKLEFKFQFEFNDEFDPIISYLGMQVSPDSLSSGQRKKMNLIILLAFIEIIKMKHNHMNVMFLDEIFSSLDKINVYKAIEILKEYATKYNMTIFVVSHESLPEEFFDYKIMVNQVDHFSEMKIIKI
jgi:DNA repair exonuclease SbcCD ATPase subunit